MASIRAYYLPADPASEIDTSHPVSVEELNALGWKMFSVGGSHDEIEQAGQKLAQKLGYPVTQEGCIIPFNLELEKNAAAMAPEMATLLMKAAEVASENSNICVTNGVVAAVTSGSPYLDVEDIIAAGWVRIHVGAGTLFCVPTGAKYRVTFNEQNRDATGIAFFKETISNPGLLVKKEIDNHPARQAYLSQVLGQT
ncbi:hypothetical protein BDP27DRAFT_1366164 [Rhodocollybia butyracea]|uniref:Uncharacterized protein n=1 Tax=Rhodocollybia butyracea TaxID=206335 RepID=A0A9P5U5H0_9AGAR|nr:hypothetical protein BDP27DRAFT_1366164 [Rhodocollybia butyracea]